MMWEVQHRTLFQGWVNTWTRMIGELEVPWEFDSQREAQKELDNFLKERPGYSSEEFRVVPVEE